MNVTFLRASEVAAYHDQAIDDPHAVCPVPGALGEAIARNHRNNCLLWDEEDLARRRDVPDAEIAANKRAIDGFNQKRNDATEAIDELILAALEGIERLPSCRLNSETAGSMIDRLSILALKVYHMHEQTLRQDVDEPHRARCLSRLTSLREQRSDLQGCLDALLSGCVSGAVYYKIYRQFKMYNDPTLNPQLYRGRSAPGSEPRGR